MLLRQLTVLLGLSVWMVLSQEGETDTIDDLTEEYEDEGVTIENGVHVLTTINFSNFVESQDLVMVEFYAPWCGHCKKLAPEYDAAAFQLKEAGSVAVLAKVDADEHKELGSKFGVQGFPTLKIFKKGVEEPINYDGGRTTFDIVEKMKELSDPNWEPPKSEVLELTTDIFHDTVNKEPIMLVEFFAPWCGHCKKLKPEYENAARQLKSHNIPLATVDATVENSLAKEFGVTGYPTLKIFRNGKVSDFKGGRTASEIVSTMVVEKNPHTYEITSSAHKKEVEKADTVRVVGLFPGMTPDSEEFQLFQEMSNDFRSSYPCSHSFDAAFAAKTFKVSSAALVVVYPAQYVAKKEKAFATIPITAESSISDVTAAISSHDKPLVGDYDCTNCNKIYDVVDTVRVYTSKEYGKGFDKNTKYWQEKSANVARKFAGKGLHFVLCDESKQTADMDVMKLTGLGAETVFGIKTAKGDKYSPDEDVLDDMDDFAETMEEFLEDYLAGKIKPRRKSAPAPKKQTGPVTVVVGSTFEAIVHDPTRDVLVEFYAPWCGHCKALEPKYNQLAKELKGEKNLVIAKVDGTTNDYPGSYTVSGFPTIFFMPAGGDKEPILYSGEREVEDLKNFIKENSVLAFSGMEVLREEL